VGHEHFQNLTATDGNQVTSFVVHRPIRHADKSLAPVLVMFYEDFVRDFEESTRRLYAYLKEHLGEAMPSVEDAVACSVSGRNREEKAKRVSKDIAAPYNPYHDPKGAIGPNMLAKWCSDMKEYWFESKWGPCIDAKIQVERHVPVRLANAVPENSC